jgi:protein-disulfide isomerase
MDLGQRSIPMKGATMRIGTTLAALAAVLAFGGATAEAQTSEQVLGDMRKEMEALKEGQKGIQKELQEIKALLRGRATAEAPPDDTPQNLVLNLDGASIKGNKSAKLVLLEFTDYQ